MAESIFSKVYSYRERENKDSKENFLIEIFAHCLQYDPKLLREFLTEIDVTLDLDKEIKIKTQSIYENGRPDVEISIKNRDGEEEICIFIECKIEHFERPNQLEDYRKILEQKNVTERRLVYLTKYYDYKENVYPIKWSDIYSIIDDQNTLLSQELKSYIKDENMSESKNLTYSDLATLKTISGTIRKMDEVIDGVSDFFETKIGVLSRDSARSTGLQNENYALYHKVGGSTNIKYFIETGFYWEWDDEIYLCIGIWLPKKIKNTEIYKTFFSKNLKKWELEEYDKGYYFWYHRSVAQFILDDEEQIKAMIEFLREGITELANLKKINPKIFK